jgi:hypothetical protein
MHGAVEEHRLVREKRIYVHGRGSTLERPSVVEAMPCITAVGLHPVASWVGRVSCCMRSG